jgi:beta-galactosidase
MKILSGLIFLGSVASTLSAQRVVIPLDGEWQIEDSLSATAAPPLWGHKVDVPGLANQARPVFADVDEFDSREVIDNRIRKNKLPESARVETAGVPRQNRNYFWYRKTFRAPARRAAAILKINKAQFGTAVWLNGRHVGEHLGCFTAGYFEVTPAIAWNGENELIVRIGAHPAAMPPNGYAGTDFEKNKWTPGIYDSVALLLSDNPVIESVQVAPKIGSSEILVQTKLRNYGNTAASCRLTHRVREAKGGRVLAEAAPERVRIARGSEETRTVTVRIPGAHPWSPEDPFLYTLETSSTGDSMATRFGMREFRFDTATRRAYLNGKPYFLRGSNITLHRFFEDPKAGGLPWNERWVHKLLAEVPKQMHWNSFRFCIGPVPDRWLEIADEAGLLIQNEYFVWLGQSKDMPALDAASLTGEYKEWLRDNWNHASVVIWDANNETLNPMFGEKIIPAVRDLDLSRRPWENGYNPPAAPDDPVEDHPYLFSRYFNPKGPDFEVKDLERMSGTGQHGVTPTGHAQILNEYGWLWLLRDGTPTELTGPVYERLLGAQSSGRERLALDAYLLGGLTEFWRAYRSYAGVLHFVYLTSCYPGAYTCDNFEDVEKLKLHPDFADYVGEAFKPLGVYLNFWQPTLPAGEEREFVVMMVNDESRDAAGRLTLMLERESGECVARVERRFAVAGLGQESYRLRLRMPDAPGKYLLKAAGDGGVGLPTISRRRVEIR